MLAVQSDPGHQMADLGWMSGKEGFSGVSLALFHGPVVVECGFPVVFCPEGPGGPVHPPHQVTGGGTEREVRPLHPLAVPGVCIY